MKDKESIKMINSLLDFLSKRNNSIVTYSNGIWYYKINLNKINPALFKVMYTGDFVVDDYNNVKVFDDFVSMKSFIVKYISSSNIKKRISI